MGKVKYNLTGHFLQEPHMEVLSPGSKNVQSYLVNRMLVYVYREFRAKEKPGFLPSVRADELAAFFPGLTDAFMRKRLKLCADLKVCSVNVKDVALVLHCSMNHWILFFSISMLFYLFAFFNICDILERSLV